MAPMTVAKPTAGMTAEGAFPKAAIPVAREKKCETLFYALSSSKRMNGDNCVPAGKLRAAAPTMLLTRLRTSLGMVALPPDSGFVWREPFSSALLITFPSTIAASLALIAVVESLIGVARTGLITGGRAKASATITRRRRIVNENPNFKVFIFFVGKDFVGSGFWSLSRVHWSASIEHSLPRSMREKNFFLLRLSPVNSLAK